MPRPEYDRPLAYDNDQCIHCPHVKDEHDVAGVCKVLSCDCDYFEDGERL